MTDTTLPTLDALVAAADADLHPWVVDRVPADVRRAALAEELRFWLETAAQDLDHATTYAAAAPQSGEPPQAYLDRWLPLSDGVPGGGHVLVGPRYLGRDPDLPFVGVSASDRPLVPQDAAALTALAREHFAAFRPGFVLLTTSDPIGAWADVVPGVGGEQRQVVGRLGDVRAGTVPPELTSRPRRDTGFYARYRAIHEAHAAAEPAHARHARLETEDDLAELAAGVGGGVLHDVLVDGVWAGLVAAEPDVRRGVRGATVIELVLDPAFRGLGHGRSLSVLLARALDLPDDECLLGTIHVDNTSAYASALAAGRVDVGGEVTLPL